MNPMRWILALIALATATTACAREIAPLIVTSPDLPPGKPIADTYVGQEFGCSGGAQSPAIAWAGAPPGTRSFMVTMFDPFHPPQSGWWHWQVIDIPATAHSLPRGAGNPGGALPAPARQLKPDGDAPVARYYGPCPDRGEPAHHYVITVYALDVDHLDLPATATPASADYAALGHALAAGRMIRDYQRH